MRLALTRQIWIRAVHQSNLLSLSPAGSSSSSPCFSDPTRILGTWPTPTRGSCLHTSVGPCSRQLERGQAHLRSRRGVLANTQHDDQQHHLASSALPEEFLGSESETEELSQQQEEPQLQPGCLPDRIGFIGAGQMGEALIRGFVASGVSTFDRLSASVRSAERQHTLSSLGISVFGSALEGGAADIAANSDIIFLGVKPQYLDGILEALAPHVTRKHLVISIAAGVRVAGLEGGLPEGTRVVRVMPNTPCLIGQAASAYVLGNNATQEDASRTYALMSSVGLAIHVEERMMDAVTALSGSGPAYVFMVVEAMTDGAVAAGLPRDKALALAAQTVVGAARMVFEASGDGTMTHPALLKDKVTSPAGTTITGVAELETSGIRGALIRAVRAAARRSEELG